MEAGTLNQWIEGFEKELQRRFKNDALKVKVTDMSNIDEQYILDVVCKYSGITKLELLKKGRGKTKVSDSRMVICYFLSSLKKLKPHSIASLVNRDRTTILHALTTIEYRIKFNDTAINMLISGVNEIFTEGNKTNDNENSL